MRPLRFARMHGCGNDFVVVDDRDGRLQTHRAELALALCDRHKGLGGDGLILIQRDESQGGLAADFRMTYVNRTGADGEMCGNGARCAVRRAVDLGLAPDRGRGTELRMATLAGLVRATVDNAEVTLAMTIPSDERSSVPLAIAGQKFGLFVIDTGVPHTVAFLESPDALERLDVEGIGRAIRHHEAFAPKGVNANFAARRPDGSYRMRTYERGVEMETLACGTGSVAVALAAHRRFGAAAPVSILPTGGGLLTIGFQASNDGFREVTLKGPTETIAEGEIAAEWLAVRGLTALA
ncbi:diaminopimelate epimerase [Hypericibacter sp.]|uniref:diaminopimelate epimerase n=1 Tax=Hypericibacter sp. TaxID=2705401 RepID=UPI003D6D2C60